MILALLADGEEALAQLGTVIVVGALVMIVSAVAFVLLLRGPRGARRLWAAVACAGVFLLAAYAALAVILGPPSDIPASRLLLAHTPTGPGGVLLFFLFLGGRGLLVVGGVVVGIGAVVIVAGHLARRADRLRPSIELVGNGSKTAGDDHGARARKR